MGGGYGIMEAELDPVRSVRLYFGTGEFGLRGGIA